MSTPGRLLAWKLANREHANVFYSSETNWERRFGPLSHIELVELSSLFSAQSNGNWNIRDAWGPGALYAKQAFDIDLWPQVSRRIAAEGERRAQYISNGDFVCLGTLKIVKDTQRGAEERNLP